MILEALGHIYLKYTYILYIFCLFLFIQKKHSNTYYVYIIYKWKCCVMFFENKNNLFLKTFKNIIKKQQQDTNIDKTNKKYS